MTSGRASFATLYRLTGASLLRSYAGTAHVSSIPRAGVSRFHFWNRRNVARARTSWPDGRIADQAATLVHTSNLYYHPFQAEAAARLTQLSGLPRAFFCNSGTEAVEACLKFARRY